MNKTTILDCRVDLCDSNEALERVRSTIEENRNFHIITINPEMIMNAQNNAIFKNIINNSDLNIIDGVGVKIAVKLKGIKPTQTRGIDFARELIKLAFENNYKIAFLGAKEEVLQKTCENFSNQYKGLNIVYKRNGYFSNDDEVIEELAKTKPQIVLVALGSPRQEELIVKLKEFLQGATLIGVGGSFDVFSGIVKESPIIYRKLGIEWLYRTIKQPERFKRIFPILPIFLMKCIINSVLKKG